MQKFIIAVKKITGTIAIITGFVAAIAAALEAFTSEMKKRYPDDKKEQANEATNS